MSRADDPGWAPALRAVPLILFPFLGAHRALRAPDGLIVLRTLWLAFLGSIVIVGLVVLALLTLDLGTGPDGRVVAGVVAAIGVVAQLLAPMIVPGLDGTSAATAVASVQRAVLVRIALAEVATLVGFVGFMVSVNPGVYLVGAVIGVAGLLDTMPSAERIDRWQQDLRETGSTVELLPALRGTGITR